jgi:hypothetical protein
MFVASSTVLFPGLPAWINIRVATLARDDKVIGEMESVRRLISFVAKAYQFSKWTACLFVRTR